VLTIRKSPSSKSIPIDVGGSSEHDKKLITTNKIITIMGRGYFK
jgi:hypothetical protein